MLIIIGSIAGLVIVGLFYFYRTQTVWVESKPYRRVSEKPANTLVVVYSRTGNTMGAIETDEETGIA